MSISDSGFAANATKGHTEPETAARNGDGGGTLPIWTADPDTKLNRLIGSTFTNNSSFELPSGVVSGNFGASADKLHGVGVQGTIVGADGGSLSGNLSLTAGSNTIAKKTTRGFFRVSATPPDGVTAGQNVDTISLDLSIDPGADAVSVVQTGITGVLDLGTIKYGSVSGTVTDYNGNPVENDTVSAPGAASRTDSDGKYKLSAPGGTSVDLTALSESRDLTITPDPGQDVTQDFQYGGLSVQVVLPDGKAVPNVVANVDRNVGSINTGENGTDVYPRAPVTGTITAEVAGGAVTEEVPAPAGGSLAEATFRLGWGLRGEIRDEEARPVPGVDIEVLGAEPIRSVTTQTGDYAIGALSGGDVDVRIAGDDRRYVEVTVDANELDDVLDSTYRENVDVRRQTNVGKRI